MSRLIILLVAGLTAPIHAQLESGHYLVGTQGWVNNLPDARLNTVQLVDAYSNRATVLSIRGVPAKELPSAFFVNHPAAFLMGTKVAATPADGNVYRVTYSGGSWTANKLNTSALGINVGGMVVDSAYAYVTGSAEFGTGATDGQVLRIARSNGAVSVLKKFGAKFMTNGARGSTGGMVRIGTTLHIFTFNSSTSSTQNEHWTVSTTTGAASKLGPDLPMSKRFLGRGFASSAAVVDPVSGDIVVVGRWGELQFRSPTTGANLRYEQVPGRIDFSTNRFYTEMWRAAAVNLDTSALAFGDHHDHRFGTTSIDERRCSGASPASPFQDDVSSTTFPAISGTVISSVSAMTYVPADGTFLPTGNGCPVSTGATPCSYVTSPPSAGNRNFGFTVRTNASSATLMLGTKLNLSLAQIGAPGCVAYVSPLFVAAANTVNGTATFRIPIPANAPSGATVYAQWLILDPSANALGIALSEGRVARLR